MCRKLDGLVVYYTILSFVNDMKLWNLVVGESLAEMIAGKIFCMRVGDGDCNAAVSSSFSAAKSILGLQSEAKKFKTCRKCNAKSIPRQVLV